MVMRQLAEGIYWVGAIDWDRRLFDALIPTPEGTSYNAYLIQGSRKTALIDTVDPSKEDELLANLKALNIRSIDYIIPNHAEQDHSGTIGRVLATYPMAKLVTNEKCRDLLQRLLLLPDEVFLSIQDGETLDLGNRTLEFLITPWVHWPETMLTYLREDKILFPCDFLGSHYAASDLFARNRHTIYEAAKRYFAEIMMPFRGSIRGHLERLSHFEIRLIAPSHGPVWDDPKFILDAYAEWTSDRMKDEVVLAYVSMHGSTQRMVDHLIDALISRGVTVRLFNLTVTDLGELAKSLVDAATVVVGTPTILFGPHPAALYATYLVSVLKPKTAYASIIGSYGWGGKTVKVITDMLSTTKMELIPPVVVQGYPKEEDFLSLNALADEIAKRHRENPLIQKGV
ncbi:MAG: FprA family A-type flavoprotein [Methanomicrobiales archaeon]|nr:FprA family A-type flavoprotein [Methanomicrobiales archaeon]